MSELLKRPGVMQLILRGGGGGGTVNDC